MGSEDKQKLNLETVPEKMSMKALVTHYFPEDILLEIFHKLPVKSLGKCMCVSKAWNLLIKNPSFVSSHLHYQSKNSSRNKNNLLFNVRTVVQGQRFREKYSLLLDDHELSEYTQLQHIPLDHPCYILGSCNGLLCLFTPEWDLPAIFIVCNPIIRKCIRLPQPCFTGFPDEISYGFGFDSIRNDYKLLKIMSKSDKYSEVELYSVNRNSWKTLAPIKYELCSSDIMVLVNGVVHCIAIERMNDNGHSRDKCFLLGFDMCTDVFKEILLPEGLSNLVDWSEMYVVSYDDLSSIAVIEFESVSFCECNIWVMKKYGMVETWTKMFHFETEESMLRVLGFRKNGGLIINGANQGQVVLHDLESNEIINFGIQRINGDVISYKESLVVLNQDASDDFDSVDKSTGDARQWMI